MNARLATQPVDHESCFSEQRGVGVGGLGDAFLAIVKNINIVGVARPIAINGTGARDIALGIAMTCQGQQDLALDPR